MMWMHRSKDNVSQVATTVVQGQGLEMKINSYWGNSDPPNKATSTSKEETGHKKLQSLITDHIASYMAVKNNTNL